MFKRIVKENFTRRLYYLLNFENLMNKRSRTDIVAQILMAASDSITRTTAMYSAFVDYAQLKDYLAILTKNRLLEYDQRLQTYMTTEKGLKFLRMYNSSEERSIRATVNYQ